VVTAQVKLPRLIRDSMILQRDSKINIWGWASKGEKIKIKDTISKRYTSNLEKLIWN